MSRLFYHTMQDNAGNLLFGVSGTMRIAGSGTLATIYGDEGLTVPIGNPMANHTSYGSFKCYLAPGLYDFYMAKAGYSFETLTGVQGGGTMASQDANNVTITGGVVSDLSTLGANALGVGEPAQGASFRLLVASGNSMFRSNVGMGDQVPAYPLHVGGLGAQITQLGLGTGPSGTYSLVAAFQALFQAPVGIKQNPPAYDLHVNGTAAKTGGGSWVDPTSSQVLKRNIRPLVGALAALLAVEGRQWEWADDQPELEQQLPGTRTGLVIEEVQEKRPEWIALDSEGRPGLWTAGFEALVIEALRELAARVAVLEGAAP